MPPRFCFGLEEFETRAVTVGNPAMVFPRVEGEYQSQYLEDQFLLADFRISFWSSMVRIVPSRPTPKHLKNITQAIKSRGWLWSGGGIQRPIRRESMKTGD